MGKLFGTDGIRGRANAHPMDGETAFKVGRAAGSFFQTRSDEKKRVVIGQDTRISGDMLSQAVAAGMCAAGLHVSPLGVLPTPGVAHITKVTNAAAGVVISASHNPFEDNGIKFFDADGFKLSEVDEDRIEALLKMPGETLNVETPHGVGALAPSMDAHNIYLNYLTNVLPEPSLGGLTIALDCANGATYRIAPQLFRQLGAQVISLFCSPDGTNINTQCGSQHPDSLARTVVDKGADLGLAFDGDGDRLIAVDEQGKVLSGDQIMAICAHHLLQKGALKHNTVVSTVMSNLGFVCALKELGVEVHTTPVGDRHVMEKMRNLDAILGGEDSGHIIFLDCHTTGDGLVAALRLINAMQHAGQPLSRLSQIMTVYPQELINVTVKSKPDLDTLPKVMEAIQEVENDLGDNGRVLVRYSGTQPMCRAMVEGPTVEVTRKHCQYLASVIQEALG